MFDEYSSDESDEEFTPYTYDKCKYGYYVGCSGCCKRCRLEKREQEYDEYMKEYFNDFLKEQFKSYFKEEKILTQKEYKILCINKTLFIKLSTDKKIKLLRKQYKKLSLKYHPDKNGDSSKFIKLKEAYDILMSDLVQ